MSKIRSIGAAALVAALSAAPAAAETIPVEGAVEAWKVFVEQRGNGPVTLRAIPCRSCDARRFALSDDFQLILKGQPVSFDRLARLSGQSATVIYNLESGRAVRLLQ